MLVVLGAGIPTFIRTWDPYFHMEVGMGSPISYHIKDPGVPKFEGPQFYATLDQIQDQKCKKNQCSYPFSPNFNA